VKKVEPRAWLAALVGIWALHPRPIHAYVDVELEGNGHVIGESYASHGDKLTVFRPSGAVELDRSSVRAIHERSGDLPIATGNGTGTELSSAVRAPAATGPSSIGTSQAQPKDRQTQDRELAKKLMNMRFERLTAMQRGDDATVKSLDKGINKFQSERSALWKKPGSAGATERPDDD